MTPDERAARALYAYDVALDGKPPTLSNRIEAMRAALVAGTPRQEVAMCETCFTTFPLTNAPAVCPVCTHAEGRNHD